MGSTISDRIGTMQFDSPPMDDRRLRRIVFGAMALVAVLVLLPNTFTYINPGYVGIVIHRAGGGVDNMPLGPGVHPRIPFATGIEEYPVFLQDAGARAERRGRIGAQRRDQREQRGGAAALAGRVALVPARPGADAEALLDVSHATSTSISHGFVKQAIRQALQEVVGTGAGRRRDRPKEGGGDESHAS